MAERFLAAAGMGGVGAALRAERLAAEREAGRLRSYLLELERCECDRKLAPAVQGTGGIVPEPHVMGVEHSGIGKISTGIAELECQTRVHRDRPPVAGEPHSCSFGPSSRGRNANMDRPRNQWASTWPGPLGKRQSRARGLGCRGHRYTAAVHDCGATKAGMAEEQIVEQRAGARLVEPDASQYPDSDGLPMAENDEHCRAILSIRGPLEVRFHGSSDTYVTGDLLLYYKEGERKSVAPDVMVVRGVPTGPRRTYLLWEEGKPPDFVAEVSSPSSRSYDRTSKRALYAKLGVREYFLFDPVYEEPGHDGALQGYRLWGSESVEMGPGGGAELRSEVLGLSLRPEGKRVRLRDLATGQDLLWFEETENARRAAEDALRALERQRDEEAVAWRAPERQRDEEAVARRAAEDALRALERQRDEEAVARRAAEARVAELEALLRASNTPSSKGTRR